ncbi:LysM peptidoglycan-binding domain-containing protein [Flavobacterium praedii]|uniref:LysM peptidoglycan-binding domain-containing protein n=1 Tax=Flavobacterium praedii TaxID=3002900 RepID=UPI002481EAF9|nr:LysM peptidoglycan-binding domain-containing protein [Flavobacterium praedii]
MALQEKYSELINTAKSQGVTNLQVREQNNVLYIDGAVSSSAAKDTIWAVYEKIDPEFRSADVVMNLTVPEGAGTPKFEVYTVVGGDSLSKIAGHYGTTWQKIFEINKDVISNPDMIKVGWKIKIPKG